jgi:hypothetical protein
VAAPTSTQSAPIRQLTLFFSILFKAERVGRPSLVENQDNFL